MAVKPITPRDYGPDPCGECPTIYFGTAVVSGPLYLIGTFTTFRTEPHYKTIRGVPVLCGAKLRLWDTFCIKEEAGGNGLDHIFQLPCADNGAVMWYVIADNCRNDLASGFTHVIRYVYEGCEDPIHFCALTRTTNLFTSVNDAEIPWQAVVAGDPTLWLPLAFIDVGDFQILRAYSFGRIRRSGVAGTTSYRFSLWLEGSDQYLATDEFSLGPGQEHDWLMNGLGIPESGDILGLRMEVLSGFQAFSIRGGDHPMRLTASEANYAS